jgi:3-oxoacyl-[acyl-carrier-protein] synthase II
MSHARRRVVVTGTGAVSAAGLGVEAFWRACVDGRSMLRPATRFDSSDYASPRVGEVPTAALAAAIERGGTEPAAAFAVDAAAQAVEQARLTGSSWPETTGAVLGTCLGGADALFDRIRGVADRTVSCGALGAPAARLAREHDLRGPLLTVSIACASGTAAIGLAADCIARGEADRMLAGGVDALSRFVVSGFWSLRALAAGETRPFDRRRDGLALGEGAGIVVLEDREIALARGAPVLAEVLGSGSSGDAHHMTAPSPTGDGVVRAIEAALCHAGLEPRAVDFVSAHGTGTTFNDRMETIALKRVFAEHARQLPVNSIKPIVGHTLGAAGALEAILCVRVLRDGIVPPTINYHERDPECDLDYVPGRARRHAVTCALSCSSAFGGSNATLLLGRA